MNTKAIVRKDSELIEAIRLKRTWAVNQLYLKHMIRVKSHLKTKGCPGNEILEHYNDAFIAFINVVNSDYFSKYNGELLPWFKKVSERYYFKSKNKKPIIEIPSPQESPLIKMIREEEKNLRHNKLTIALNNLKNKCKAIIDLTFFSEKKHSSSDIAIILSLKNASVVDVSRSRCIKKLKEEFHKTK